MATDFFKQGVTLARQEAIPMLRARAEREGLVISICAWCLAYTGEQPGRGVNGISHSICEPCLKEQQVATEAVQ